MQLALISAVMLALVAGLAAPDSTAPIPGPAPDPEAGEDREPRHPNPRYVLDHAARALDGTEKDLRGYEGKVVLIVNTASRCGLTPQYEALEKLYREHKDAGLVVLGFPANDFKGQEPLSNEQIAEFCAERFDVTFPMFEKISVKGEQRHPLYADLVAQPEPAGGEPTWNFTKYLVNRAGEAVERFDPRTTPDDERLVARIKELLAEPAPGADAGERE